MSIEYDEDWYPTSDDPVWADITPIELTDDDQKFVSILGSPQYRAIMSYLRALLANKEYSQRGFNLSTVAVLLLPSNYTAWHYRRECIDAINGDWDVELDRMIAVSEENPKTYQVWQHRKMCVTKLLHPRNELVATEEYIINDQKNYHVWGYRQWLLRTFPHELSYALTQAEKTKNIQNDQNNIILNSPITTVTSDLITTLSTQYNSKSSSTLLSGLDFDEYKKIPLHLLPLWIHELNFCNILLSPEQDVRNNSAWNQRMFVLQFAFQLLAPYQYGNVVVQCDNKNDENNKNNKNDEKLYNENQTLYRQYFHSIWFNEVDIIIKSLSLVLNNESALNYLHGLCNLQYKYNIVQFITKTNNINNNITNITNNNKIGQYYTLYLPDTNNSVVSPGLSYVANRIYAAWQFSLVKSAQKMASTPSTSTPSQTNDNNNTNTSDMNDDDDDKSPIVLQNRFILSFLVDLFDTILSTQSTSIFFPSFDNDNSSTNNITITSPTTHLYNFQITTNTLKMQQDNYDYASLHKQLSTSSLDTTNATQLLTLVDNYDSQDTENEEKSKILFSGQKYLLEQMIKISHALATVDPIRAKYWIYRSVQIENTLTQLQQRLVLM